MKKIFPIITILVFISLLGVIFSQVLWIKQSVNDKEQQFEESIKMVTVTAGNDLVEEKGNLSPFDSRKSTNLFFPLNVFSSSIAHKFTREEIRSRIKKAFEKNNIKDVDFEFAVTTTSMIGDELQSKNFYEAYQDSLHNRAFVYPLESPSGSIAEGLSAQELLIIVVPHVNNIIWRQMYWMVAGAIVFTFIIFAAFFITIRALLNQKKLSEIKSDFINNMTHEFKTPLATISLAVDALKNEKVINDKAKWQYFNNIIKDENKRMNKHVETILQAALMEKQEFRLNLIPVHIHELLPRIVDNFQLQLHEKNGKVEFLLNAANDLIHVDEVHFTNILSNLIDNAIKYSKENLLIKLRTHRTPRYFIIQIQDNGIGMSKETVKRVFEKFYRAHTGNLHNVKGFGLGMSYVKSVADAHKGKIRAESTLGKGSTFTIEIPTNPTEIKSF